MTDDIFEKEMDEALEEKESDKKENAWTSVDLYYKGFHIKKSLPVNISPESLIARIDEYIEQGFKPSWNDETNGKNSNIEQPTLLTKPCEIEGCQGTMTFKSGVSKKTGKPWKAWFCDLSEKHVIWEK